MEKNKMLQQQLLDAYKHIGIINRKVSLLSELHRHSLNNKNQAQIANYILKSAINITGAGVALLYLFKAKGDFHMEACTGIEKDQIKRLKMSIYVAQCSDHLNRTKRRMHGEIKSEGEAVFGKNKMEYFIALPLLEASKLKGFIFLGFKKYLKMDKHDWDFIDIFAIQAAISLIK